MNAIKSIAGYRAKGYRPIISETGFWMEDEKGNKSYPLRLMNEDEYIQKRDSILKQIETKPNETAIWLEKQINKNTK